MLRLRGHTPDAFRDYDVIARWNAAGQFLGSQAIRSTNPVTEVQTLPMAIARQGAVVIAGYSLPNPNAPTDLFVAAFRSQSQSFCAGDGSAGPCPCGNAVPAGTPGGCKRGGMTVGARLDDQGIASLGSDSLRFFASFLPTNGTRLLLQGTPSATATAFQDGLLCLTGPIVRLHAVSATGQYADLPPAFGTSIAARSAQLGDPILPGSSRAYQLYFRGGTSACGVGNGNVSNGIVVSWEL